MTHLLSLLAKYKAGAKVTGAIGGGTGLLALVGYLHQDVKSEIQLAEKRSQEYTVERVKEATEGRWQILNGELKYLKENVDRNAKLLERIDRRVYELNQKSNQ